MQSCIRLVAGAARLDTVRSVHLVAVKFETEVAQLVSVYRFWNF